MTKKKPKKKVDKGRMPTAEEIQNEWDAPIPFGTYFKLKKMFSDAKKFKKNQ